MFFIKTIKDKYNRLTKTYEGTVYQVKEGNNIFFTKGNWMNKTEVACEKIIYKRPLISDLYVKEITSGKRIPTFVLHKFFRLPVHTFVLIERKGKNFCEEEAVPSEKDYARYNNLKYKKDEKKIKEDIKQFKDDLIEYKKVNKKEKLNLIFKNGREKRSRSKFSFWHLIKIFKNNKLNIFKDIKKINFISTLKVEKVKNLYKDKIRKKINEDKNLSQENKFKNEMKETLKAEKEENNIEDVVKEKVEEPIFKENDKDIKVSNSQKIKDLKQLKADLYICDYWLNKYYPKKEIITIANSNKTIQEFAKEIVNNISDNNVVKANIDGIKITTQILKTEKEILAYYMYKKYNNKNYITDDIKENCYQMIRIDRNLKKKELKK